MQNIYSSKTDDTDAYVEIKIPRTVLDALKTGKVSLTCEFGKQGVDSWFRYTDPEVHHISHCLDEADSLLGVLSPPRSPTKLREPDRKVSFKQKEKKILRFEDWSSSDDSDDQVTVTPTNSGNSKKISKTHGTDASQMTMGQAASGPTMPLDVALARVASKNLNRYRHNGVLNEYATDSLVPQDFKRVDVDDFLARITVVASAITNAKALSRLSAGGMNIPGAVTLADWWSKAPVEWKLKLMSKNKKCPPNLVTNLHRLANVGCPFQDAGLSEDSD